MLSFVEKDTFPVMKLAFLPAFNPTDERLSSISSLIHHLSPGSQHQVALAVSDICEIPFVVGCVSTLLKEASAVIPTLPTHHHVSTIWDSNDLGITIPMWVTGGLSHFGEAPTNLYPQFRLLSLCPSLILMLAMFAEEDLPGAPA